MWFLYAVVTLVLWAIADLFYKKGAKEEDKYSHLKTGVMVGLVMGIHALGYILLNGVSFTFMDILKYLPVSFFYIISMVVGYKGLRYIELSISSPIQNSSGVITSLLLFIIFRESLGILNIIAIVLIGIGVTLLTILSNKKEETEENKQKLRKIKSENKFKFLQIAILFPLLYCILDGAGTFLDAIYLDKLEIIGEDPALIAYELTFFLYGMLTWLYLKLVKKESINIPKEKEKVLAAIFETFGQFTYVFAMGANSTLSAPIVGSYCMGSVLLSRVFLKEKLNHKEYISIAVVFCGILLMGIAEGIG